jgi:DNA replication and repair protein RecF
VLYVGPEDREQVAGPPAARRALLDGLLEQSEPAYLLALREYRRALRQRNRALARPGAPDGEIEIWDEPLAQAGGEVLARRVAAVEALAPRAAAWHRELAAADGGGASLAVAYSGTAGRPAGGGAAGWAAALLAALAAGRDRDRATGTTGAGPHRDDVALALDGRPMKGTASSGEIWTAILSLTLAAAERLGERLGRLPALLLDDVLAALDGARRARVLAVLREFPQALLATTDAPPSAWPGTVFAVRAHRVTRIPAAAGGEDTAWERRPDPALSARC